MNHKFLEDADSFEQVEADKILVQEVSQEDSFQYPEYSNYL